MVGGGTAVITVAKTGWAGSGQHIERDEIFACLPTMHLRPAGR